MAKIKKRETTDEVIQEMRKIKETLAESMDFDIDRILQDARNKQRDSKRKIIPPPIRQEA